MSNDFYPAEEPQQPGLEDGLSTWDEIRRMADELELKVHLASMNARDRWRDLEPRLARIEAALKRTGRRASDAVSAELAAFRKMLAELRDEIVKGN